MATAPSRGHFVANCTDKLPGGAGQPRTRDARPAELTGAVSSRRGLVWTPPVRPGFTCAAGARDGRVQVCYALRGRCTARPRAGLLRLVRAGRKRRVDRTGLICPSPERAPPARHAAARRSLGPRILECDRFARRTRSPRPLIRPACSRALSTSQTGPTTRAHTHESGLEAFSLHAEQRRHRESAHCDLVECIDLLSQDAKGNASDGAAKDKIAEETAAVRVDPVPILSHDITESLENGRSLTAN